MDWGKLQQGGEVLDGAAHLRNVGVLVVVPGNDLNLAGAVAQVDDHGLGTGQLFTDNIPMPLEVRGEKLFNKKI